MFSFPTCRSKKPCTQCPAPRRIVQFIMTVCTHVCVSSSFGKRADSSSAFDACTNFSSFSIFFRCFSQKPLSPLKKSSGSIRGKGYEAASNFDICDDICQDKVARVRVIPVIVVISGLACCDQYLTVRFCLFRCGGYLGAGSKKDINMLF